MVARTSVTFTDSVLQTRRQIAYPAAPAGPGRARALIQSPWRAVHTSSLQTPLLLHGRCLTRYILTVGALRRRWTPARHGRTEIARHAGKPRDTAAACPRPHPRPIPAARCGPR